MPVPFDAPPSETRPSWTVLAAYLSGDATPADRHAVEGWAACHHNHAHELARLKRAWAAARFESASSEWSADDAWLVFERTHLDPAATTTPITTPSATVADAPSVRGTWYSRTNNATRNSGAKWIGWGIGLAFGVLFAMVVSNYRQPVTPRVSVQTYATAVAQQTTVALPGGDTAVLGPASTLEVTTPSTGQGTTVTVHGQALFTVVHNNRAPFVVRTGTVQTRVLGTTFFVRKYASDKAARVAVIDGRVAVRDTGRSVAPVALSRGTLAVVSDSGTILTQPIRSAEDYTEWSAGRLVFHDTPVSDVIDDLNRFYGSNIRVTDSVLTRTTLTWSVTLSQRSLAGVLDVLATTLDAHCVRTGSVILIEPGRKASAKSHRRSPFNEEASSYGK